MGLWRWVVDGQRSPRKKEGRRRYMPVKKPGQAIYRPRMERMSARGGPGMSLAKDEVKSTMAGWNPWRAGEVARRGGVARMRGASNGGLGGGETLCVTRGGGVVVRGGISGGGAVESSSSEMNQGRVLVARRGWRSMRQQEGVWGLGGAEEGRWQSRGGAATGGRRKPRRRRPRQLRQGWRRKMVGGSHFAITEKFRGLSEN